MPGPYPQEFREDVVAVARRREPGVTLKHPGFHAAVDLEFNLLTPRLLLELGHKDRVIALWLQRQIQRMQLTVSRTDRVKISVAVAESLIMWHHRDRDAGWFRDQLLADPVAKSFAVPKRIKLRQVLSGSLSWMQIFMVPGGLAAIVRQATKAESET